MQGPGKEAILKALRLYLKLLPVGTVVNPGYSLCLGGLIERETKYDQNSLLGRPSYLFAMRRRCAAEAYQQHILVALELTVAVKGWELSDSELNTYQPNILAVQTRAYIVHRAPNAKAFDAPNARSFNAQI